MDEAECRDLVDLERQEVTLRVIPFDAVDATAAQALRNRLVAELERLEEEEHKLATLTAEPTDPPR